MAADKHLPVAATAADLFLSLPQVQGTNYKANRLLVCDFRVLLSDFVRASAVGGVRKQGQTVRDWFLNLSLLSRSSSAV